MYQGPLPAWLCFYVIFFLILGLSMYFLIYRPRRKQNEQRQKTMEDLKKGDRVKIVFKNTQGFHDWTLADFNVKTQQIQAGQSDTIEFVADKAGTFEFICSVPTHKDKGMMGKLIVEE